MRLMIALFSCLLSFGVSAASVATVSPIAYSMTQALLVDTPVKVVHLPPKRLPINRIPNWLNKNRTEPQASFDALITIRSLRPEMDFYNALRKENIKTVPIDIAQAMLPGGEKVAVQSADEYFWLNPNNSLLMLGILKRDLSLMWPEYSDAISTNHKKISNQLRDITLTIDDLLMASGVEGVLLSDSAIRPFSQSLILPSLTSSESDGLKVITLSSKPTEGNWYIDDFSRLSPLSFTERWETTLLSLKQITGH